MKKLMQLTFITLFLLINSSTSAITLSAESVPKPLQPWVEWALYDVDNYDCPFHYQGITQYCQWLSQLDIRIVDNSASFTQTWQVYSENWGTLLGNKQYWPQDVYINNKPAIVTERNELPAVFLPKGRVTITGKLAWKQRPEFLQAPKNAGLVALTIQGESVPIPDVDEEGRIWLRKRSSEKVEEAEENRLDLRVYRHFIDEIPLQSVIHIELEVSGRPREVVLGPALLDKHQPMSLDSPLPARLEPDGRLRMQARPGSWVVTIRTRQVGDSVKELHLKPLPENAQWVSEEIWVFESHNELRLIEITGGIAIDPQQTNLPTEWRQFPTYQVKSGDTLTIAEKRRGDPNPPADQLNLERKFWLDFDGRGYTVQDQITGKMTQGWRLEMTEPAILGRVSITEFDEEKGNTDKDQFITRLEGSKNAGVEVRRGEIYLKADSRLEENAVDLPAVGWNHDFQSLTATVILPPGVQLLDATGADSVSNTWLKRWSLLDLFLVLILTLAVSKLWSWHWGIIMGLTLVLIYHEVDAPRFIWLSILAALSLLRVLPTLGNISRFIRLYLNISLVTLLIIGVPFMIQQARQGLFPQLERPWSRLSSDEYVTTGTDSQNTIANVDLMKKSEEMPMSGEGNVVEQQAIQPRKMMPPPAPSPEQSSSESKFYDYGYSMKKSRKELAQVDPNAQVQTGPGLPQWTWHEVNLLWNGPVNKDQQIHLYLLSPTANRILSFMRVCLVFVLTGFLLWVSWGSGRNWQSKKFADFFKSSPTVSLIAIILFCCFSVSYANDSLAPAQNPELLPPVELPQPVAPVNPFPVQNTQKMDIPPPVEAAENLADSSIQTSVFPNQALLDELKKRLTAPPDCLPFCASISRMFVEVEDKYLMLQLEMHAEVDTAVPLPGESEQWLPQQVWIDNQAAQGLMRDNKYLWLYLPQGIHTVKLVGVLPKRTTFQLPLPLKPHSIQVKLPDTWKVGAMHEDQVTGEQLQFTRQQQSTEKSTELEMGSLPPFMQIERTLLLGLDWQVETRVFRLTPTGTAVVLEIPLLSGESVTSERVRVENGKALVTISAQESEISWISMFAKQDTITLTAPDNISSTEIWRVDTSAIWHLETEGISVIHHQNEQGQWLPEWRPWPGESVTLKLTRPTGIAGQVLTIDRSQLYIEAGQRATKNTLTVNLRSSRGGQHVLTLPEGAELQSVHINEQSQPIRQEGRSVTLPINPGFQKIALVFQENQGITEYFQTSSVNLGVDSVNTHIEVSVPNTRWILFVDGTPMGPAVLVWGILIVIIFVSIGLGQVSITPLKTRHWLLLGLVLSQVPVAANLCVVAWLVALGLRAKLSADTSKWQFNAIQLGLIALTIVALYILLFSIKQGLLGQPNMHIAGNGSWAGLLRWFEDRTSGTIPEVWVFSLPLWVYRIAMLLWALWLSFALLRWFRWGWQCYSTHALWKPLELNFKGIVKIILSIAVSGIILLILIVVLKNIF